MAIVHVMLSDGFKDGNEIISLDVQTDRQGLPQQAPNTPAMLAGLTVVRLWQSGALARMIGPVCLAEVKEREAAIQALKPAQEGAPANDVAPPAGAAEKLSPLEIASARENAEDAPTAA